MKFADAAKEYSEILLAIASVQHSLKDADEIDSDGNRVEMSVWEMNRIKNVLHNYLDRFERMKVVND